MPIPSQTVLIPEEDRTIQPTFSSIWSSRNTSGTSSSSTLSPVSEILSDISQHSSNPLLPSNPSASPLRPNSAPASASHLSGHIPSSAAHISLPHLPISSTSKPSDSTMINPFYADSFRGPMPIRGQKNAPPTFKGEFWKVARFLEHYNHLLEYHQVSTDKDRCHGIIEYCSRDVSDFIKSRPNYINPNWQGLHQDILKYYDADRMDSRIQVSDLISFLHQQLKKPITTLSQWRAYSRKYLATATFLKNIDQLDEIAYHGYFWFGIPESLRTIFDSKLQVKYPTYDSSSEPWPIEQIEEVAEVYFQRNKFSDKLIHLSTLGIGNKNDSEEEDDYNYFDSDEEDEEDEEEERNRYLQRLKKKSLKKKSKLPKPSKEPLPVKLLKEEPSRKITAPPEDGNIEALIHRLNTMSLEDPRYGVLYFKAISKDTTGLAAQCINRKPRQESSNKPFTCDPPPHQVLPPSNTI